MKLLIAILSLLLAFACFILLIYGMNVSGIVMLPFVGMVIFLAGWFKYALDYLDRVMPNDKENEHDV